LLTHLAIYWDYVLPSNICKHCLGLDFVCNAYMNHKAKYDQVTFRG